MDDAYSQALIETLSQMPYNSAKAFHEHAGQVDPLPELGAACILQTEDVARRAEERGAPAAVLLQDERHVAAVFHDGGGIVVLDPYLLHLEPIRFSESDIRKGRAKSEVDAVPVRHDREGRERPARLLTTYKSTENGYVIRLSYSKFSPVQQKYVLSRHFSLRSDNLFSLRDFTQDMPALLTDPEQTSVSIRAVLLSERQMVEAILPLQGFASRDFTSADIWLRTGEGRMTPNGDLPQAWHSLQEVTGQSQGLITDYLLGAAAVYQQIADSNRDVAAYSVVDE